MRLIIDSETDRLLESVTLIHCICCFDIDTKRSWAIRDYEEMIALLTSDDLTLIGHNIILFDLPVFKKILGITFKGRAIDTLALSWYLYPLRESHNLEDWGRDLGVEKPIIEDWTERNVENIIIRCQEDVKINTLLFDIQISYLIAIYDGSPAKLLGYITFKMMCAQEQWEMKWKLDIEKCTQNMEILQKEIVVRRDALRLVMPKVQTFKIVERPKVFNKKDGSLSILAERWLDLLTSQRLPPYHIGAVKVVTGEIDGNPRSWIQIKKWLFSLGWEPVTFRWERDKLEPYSKPPRAIPQVNTKEGYLCDSVTFLIDKEPGIEHLEGLSSVTHRHEILEGFMLRRDSKNYLRAEVIGLTNTLRFQHTTLVNLPTSIKDPEGYVRGVLIAPDDNHVLCGFDISGLENSTRDHFMYPYDPKYIEDMRVPYFDSHLDIAMLAGVMNEREVNWYKWVKAEKPRDKEYLKQFVDPSLISLLDSEFKALKIRLADIRDKSKKANFAAVYGAGIEKIAITARISTELARVFYTTYWKRNWSVRKIADSCKIKWVNDQMWLYNPVSELWYSLRYLKDKFSTLNQGAGSYCFDTFIRRVRMKNIKLCGQFHDEGIAPILKGEEQIIADKLHLSMEQANQELNLNVKLAITVQFGENYSQIH